MSDQAASVRQLKRIPPSSARRPTILTVASGKGGVGKTTITANLSLTLSRKGYRVLLVDGDMGLANLDMAFGVKTERDILDVVQGQCSVEEAVVQIAPELSLLPACSGRFDLANMGDTQRRHLLRAIEDAAVGYHYVILDACAGIGSNAIDLATVAKSMLLVVTPDPTSQADAYAFVKVATARGAARKVDVLVNMVRGAAEAEKIFSRMSELTNTFLDVSLGFAGFVHRDPSLAAGVIAGVPVVVAEPHAASSLCFEQVTERLFGGAGKWPHLVPTQDKAGHLHA